MLRTQNTTNGRSNDLRNEPVRPAFSCRIMCRRADGTCALVRIVPSLSAAVLQAKQIAESHLDRLRWNRAAIVRDGSRPRAIYIERWVGAATAGHWEAVERDAGGYYFEFLDRAPRTGRGRGAQAGQPPEIRGSQASRGGAPHDSPRSSCVRETDGTPKSGDLVWCELLARRTRKNGWFAKLVRWPASGPITGAKELPAGLPAGQRVLLRLCGIKLESGFAQLAWVEQPAPSLASAATGGTLSVSSNCKQSFR